jgi:hypothetical protein
LYAGDAYIDCYTDILNHYFEKDLIFKNRLEEYVDTENKILEFKQSTINKGFSNFQQIFVQTVQHLLVDAVNIQEYIRWLELLTPVIFV